MNLTRQQRIGLKRVYDRGELYAIDICGPSGYRPLPNEPIRPVTYREFRRTVQSPCYDTCIMVPWQGMWLGIETDGYTHS